MRWLSGLLVMVVLVGSTSLWAVDGDLPGSGTEGDPYLIEDLADFDEFADSVNAPTYWASGVYTRLACDPNMAGRTYTTAVIAPETLDTDWQYNGVPFTGVFDGDGHVVSNLTIDTAGAGNDYLGLFGAIWWEGEVKNLGMENSNITGGGSSYYLGGLCGYNSGTITNCYSGGSVTGGDGSWGLGGLCGYNGYGTISNCYSTGTVKGGDNSAGLGGLCGQNYEGTISNCYATGGITGRAGSKSLGGLCGVNDGVVDKSVITNCYATGSVAGGEDSLNLGGLCGQNFVGIISNCYATGSVTGSNDLGGLCGGNIGGTISDCFWDIETGGPDNGLGTPLPTAQMQTLSTFVDADWDFTNEFSNGTADIWRLCVDGTAYPRLACEFGSDYSCPDGVSIEDLLYLSSRWLESGLTPYTSADRTGDGKVTIEDYALLAEQWMGQ